MIILNNSIGYVMDVDASKVIEAIRATGVQPTHAMMNYAHTICSGLKGTGMWQNSVALYGMLGGTAESHKWNWKDLRDLDGAFRLIFTNTWAHSETGAKPNGTNAYANTFYNPSIELTSSDYIGMGYLSNTDSAKPNEYVMGIFGTALIIRRDDNRIYYETNGKIATSLANMNGKGFVFGNITPTQIYVAKNGIIFQVVNSITSSTSYNNFNIVLGGRNSGSIVNFTDKEIEFSVITVNITDQQAISSSHVITQAQNILGRA